MTAIYPSNLPGTELAFFDLFDGEWDEAEPEAEEPEAEEPERVEALAEGAADSLCEEEEAALSGLTQMAMGVGPAAVIVAVIERAIMDWKACPAMALLHARNYGYDGLGDDLHDFFNGGQCAEYLDLIGCEHLDPIRLLDQAGHPWREPPPLPRPSPHHGRKLNWPKVREIRKLWVQGHSTQAIADRYDVKTGIVQRIITNRSWKETGGDVRNQQSRKPTLTIPEAAMEKLGLVSDVQLGEEYHIPKSRVQVIRTRLGIPPCPTKYRNYRQWTAEEEALFENHNNAEIARLLGTSRNTVRRKRKRMKEGREQ